MPNKKDIIIGIDPGFDRLGIAVLLREGATASLLHSECVVTKPKESHEKRLLMIGSRLDAVIKEWSARELAIEKLFFNQNTSSALGVAEARGVIMFQAARAGLSVYEYSPQDVKIAVTGYGKADKESVATMVSKLVALPDSRKRLDDELDAIAVGITHIATKRGV